MKCLYLTAVTLALATNCQISGQRVELPPVASTKDNSAALQLEVDRTFDAAMRLESAGLRQMAHTQRPEKFAGVVRPLDRAWAAHWDAKLKLLREEERKANRISLSIKDLHYQELPGSIEDLRAQQDILIDEMDRLNRKVAATEPGLEQEELKTEQKEVSALIADLAKAAKLYGSAKGQADSIRKLSDALSASEQEYVLYLKEQIEEAQQAKQLREQYYQALTDENRKRFGGQKTSGRGVLPDADGDPNVDATDSQPSKPKKMSGQERKP